MKGLKKFAGYIFIFVALLTVVLICDGKQINAAAGIANNGTGGIYIDINSAPYTTFAQLPYGQYAYGDSGCAWFASARVNQLTGKGNTIWSGQSWWNSAGANLGFSKGSEPKAPAIVCYGGHVAILEVIDGTTAILSEGGVNQYRNWGDWNNYASSNSYTAIHAIGVDEIKSWCNQRNDFLGFVYLPSTPSHTHSYSSSVTKQPTCTDKGVKTFTCSCGNSYTEEIAAKGHSYKNTVVAPTTTEKGYTLHVCSTCNNSYKDSYVDVPVLNDDGWYHCATVPSDITSNNYTIQYKNYYEKIQKDSPGEGWTKTSTVKDAWENSGAQYESEAELPTSDSRVLVRSFYYHFCGPNAGNVGNYELSGNFVHYDELRVESAIVYSTGMDGTHPYYVLDWIDGGGRIYCQSGVTCDGSYGTHGERCQAWYKKNIYQDRVHVVQYKYTKNSGWVSSKDSSATSIEVRYKKTTQEPGTEEPQPGTEEPKPGTEEPQPGTEEPQPGVEDPIVDDKLVTPILESVKNKNGGIEISWRNIIDADGYYLYRSVNGGVYEKIADLYSWQDEYEDKYISNGNKYQYRIATYKTIDSITYVSDVSSDKVMFYLAKPAISSLKSSGSKKMTVKWKKNGKASGYEIQYSLKSNLSGKKTVQIKGTSKTKVTVNKLKKRKAYYVRMRAYKISNGKTYNSVWSTKKKVKIK